MSEEKIEALWRDIAEIKEVIKDNRKELRESLAAVKDNCIKIAKIEQRLENHSGSLISSRNWIAIVAAWFMTVTGWGITIILFLLKK